MKIFKQRIELILILVYPSNKIEEYSLALSFTHENLFQNLLLKKKNLLQPSRIAVKLLSCFISSSNVKKECKNKKLKC